MCLFLPSRPNLLGADPLAAQNIEVTTQGCDGAPNANPLARLREGKATKLCNLSSAQRRAFVDKAAEEKIKTPSLSYSCAAYAAAKPLGITFDKCDWTSIRKAVGRRFQVLAAVHRATDDANLGKENLSPTRNKRRGANRRGKSGRKGSDELHLQVDSSVLPYRGAKCQEEYIDAVKETSTSAAVLVLQCGVSFRAAAKRMVHALGERGISLGRNSCIAYIKQSVDRGGGMPDTPQKPGGVYVPFNLERRLAEVVKVLRDKKFPVFPDLVCAWCTEMIAGTEHATYFPDGKATIGWYKGWLRRMPCLTGQQRPLEKTRHEWHTEENLKQYFEVAANVFVKAGVAVRNPNYDPNMPDSEMLIITKPHLIASADETKCECDMTNPARACGDKIVRANIEDDGEVIVTKSNSAATAMCGRTGEGKALPPYIVFASGDSFHWSWAKVYESPHFVDKDGEPLKWRFASNAKGSLKEELYIDYLKTVVYPALGYPPPRHERPGEQGVLVVDGVGTHVGFYALEAAISCGLEIVLRVPNLSFVLQGEDTVNFRTFKVCACACACLVCLICHYVILLRYTCNDDVIRQRCGA